MHLLKKLQSRTNPTYLSSVFFWLLRKTTGLQVHLLYSADLSQEKNFSPNINNCIVSVVSSAADLSKLEPCIESQLNEHSGMSCKDLINLGSRVYFLQKNEKIVCQLNLRQGEIFVDSPTELLIRTKDKTAFLNYLYTAPDYRGLGLAKQLIFYSWQDLSKAGFEHCLAHIRATNYNSRKAFESASWKKCGHIITRKDGRFVSARENGPARLNIQPIKPAE